MDSHKRFVIDKVLRLRIEFTVERLITLLDEIDRDPDLEPEPIEEQHDREADPAEDGIADKAAMKFVIAETSRRKRKSRR
ncbi:hypothetical protein [Rhizobiales bacterium 3FA27D7]|jgi:hypothetical protein|uniref:hypothetical protein n=1 Tax=Mesorhizobium sp. 2RAF21 TaxID=3232995 RepID=UPI0010F871FD